MKRLYAMVVTTEIPTPDGTFEFGQTVFVIAETVHAAIEKAIRAEQFCNIDEDEYDPDIDTLPVVTASDVVQIRPQHVAVMLQYFPIGTTQEIAELLVSAGY